MLSSDYAKSYVEVLEILKYISKVDYEKIPKEKIEFYTKHMDKDYTYAIDETLEFEQQIISDITKAILANIFRDYWATENQKARISAKEKYDLQKIEEEKLQKYSANDIFKNNKGYEINETPNITALVEYKKETWYARFISYMKNIFKRKGDKNG